MNPYECVFTTKYVVHNVLCAKCRYLILLLFAVQYSTVCISQPIHKDSNKEKFIQKFDYYRNVASIDEAFCTFMDAEISEKPIANDTIYALIFSYLGRKDVDASYAEGPWYSMFEMLQKRPMEFKIMAKKLGYLPREEQQRFKRNLWELLLTEYTDAMSLDYNPYLAHMMANIEMQCRKYFKNNKELFFEEIVLFENVLSFDAWLCDSKDSTVNIRNAPNGKVVGKIK